MRTALVILAGLTLVVGQIDAAVQIEVDPKGSNDASVIAVTPTAAGVAKTFNDLEPIDLLITITEGSNAGTFTIWELEFDPYVNIQNNTSAHWTDFHLEIIPATPNDGIEFFVTNLNFQQTGFDANEVVVMEDAIWMEGGEGVPAGGELGLLYTFRYPATSDAPLSFTIRQYPTVPEPTGFLVWSMLGVASVLCVRRRLKLRA